MINRNRIFFSAIVLMFMAACTKNELSLLKYSLPDDKAYIRFAFFSPGTAATVVKVNDTKINGATTSGNGGYFPSVTTSPDYAAVPPNGTLRLALVNTGTANDSVVIFNGSFAVNAKSFYAVTLADTGIDRTVFSIQDNFIAVPDSGYFNFRMVNAMAKSPALNLIRIDSTSPTVVARDTIARNIAYKSATNFIKTETGPALIAGSSPATRYSFLRFRITVIGTGQMVGIATPPAGLGLNLRSVTTYAFGFANGTGTFAPGLSSTFVYNQ